MARKFSDLHPSEQVYFNSLVDFIKKANRQDFQTRLGVVEKFNLDINDPVIFDFLTDIDVLQDSLSPPVSVEKEILQPLTVVESSSNQVEKIQRREMTYANSEDLIIIQNRLLHAISYLTLNERRLILFLSPIVRKQIEINPNNRVFYVYVQDFVDEYGLKSKKYYGELEKIADSIVEKAFFFWYKTDNGKAKKGVSWVSECDYIENQGHIKIRLDNTVIEMLTVFDKATGHYWTQYQKEWIAHLGTYGIIMLELVLSSLESNGCYTIEHLREKFDCIDTYKKFSDFKLYVIDKAIKEIHKHTPIKIDYTFNKIGRVVKSITFSYIDNSKKIIKDKEDNNKPKEKNPFINFKMTQKQLSMFATKIKKASGQDIDEIIAELSNVHLQGKHIDFLKVLDFVPSSWYSDDEIKTHLTAEQIAEAEKAERLKKAEQERLKRKQQQEQAEAERLVKEKAEQDFIDYFEGLPLEIRELALDLTYDKIKAVWGKQFKRDRENGVVHKMGNYRAELKVNIGQAITILG